MGSEGGGGQKQEAWLKELQILCSTLVETLRGESNRLRGEEPPGSETHSRSRSTALGHPANAIKTIALFLTLLQPWTLTSCGLYHSLSGMDESRSSHPSLSSPGTPQSVLSHHSLPVSPCSTKGWNQGPL